MIFLFLSILGLGTYPLYADSFNKHFFDEKSGLVWEPLPGHYDWRNAEIKCGALHAGSRVASLDDFKKAKQDAFLFWVKEYREYNSLGKFLIWTSTENSADGNYAWVAEIQWSVDDDGDFFPLSERSEEKRLKYFSVCVYPG